MNIGTKKKNLPKPLFVSRQLSHVNRTSRGFTLLELAVTITIFVVLTTVILIKNSQFKSSLMITNLAYEVALSIRQAQMYGINVKGYGTGASAYTYSHGIHFDISSGSEAKQFQLFVDQDRDEIFESGENEGTVAIKGNNVIQDLCVTNWNDSEDCTIQSLDVTFKRPDPEAIIRADEEDSVGATYKSAKITVRSPDNVDRTIEVRHTGQISVPQ